MEDYQRYTTFDDVTYDLTDATQASSLQTIQNYFDDNIVCTKHIACGNYREYKASELTGAPTHPVSSDYGYENLKIGSLMYDITNSKTYMFDPFTDTWIEQTA